MKQLVAEEAHQHPYGSPLSLMQFTANFSVTVNFDAIDKLFQQPEVVDRKIVVISIIGAYRKGKSFFLDYSLRFMYANVSMFQRKKKDLRRNRIALKLKIIS